MKVFKNCVSLGWSCGTAASMAKYGLRGASGPFDWCLSYFPSVVEQIDTGFSDFLRRENLEPCEESTRFFRDKKHGFEFRHDLEHDIDTDYEAIVDKYNRRINRFMDQIKSPTVFFRAVRNEEEKGYIAENYRIIDHILQRYNPDNQIVYLLPENMGRIPCDVKQYTLFIDTYPFDKGLIGSIFDHSEDLLHFCESCLDSDVIEANLRFNADTNENCAANVYEMIKKADPAVWKGILSLFSIEKNDGIYLWGAGYYGKKLYEYLQKNDVKVNGMIDSAKSGTEFFGKTVLAPDEVRDGFNILISITDRKAVRSIQEKMKERNLNVRTASFYDLMKCIEAN